MAPKCNRRRCSPPSAQSGHSLASATSMAMVEPTSVHSVPMVANICTEWTLVGSTIAIEVADANECPLCADGGEHLHRLHLGAIHEIERQRPVGAAEQYVGTAIIVE